MVTDGEKTFRIKTQNGLRIGWLCFAGVMLLSASMPWYAVGFYRTPLTVPLVLFVTGISLISLASATYFIVTSIGHVDLMSSLGMIRWRVSVCGIPMTRTVSGIDRLYIANLWHHGRHRDARHRVVCVRSEGRKTILATERVNTNVVELYEWLRPRLNVKCVDARDRTLID